MSAPQYSFDESGMPTLARQWDGKLPEIPTFEETPSGRRRRGELEALVDFVVKYWLVEYEGDEQCTSEYISRECENLDGHPTSSDAVWRTLVKWEQMGYCEIATKPNRFLFFTAAGFNLGLAELQRLDKRNRKREKDRHTREHLSLAGRTWSGKRKQ